MGKQRRVFNQHQQRLLSTSSLAVDGMHITPDKYPVEPQLKVTRRHIWSPLSMSLPHLQLGPSSRPYWTCPQRVIRDAADADQRPTTSLSERYRSASLDGHNDAIGHLETTGVSGSGGDIGAQGDLLRCGVAFPVERSASRSHQTADKMVGPTGKRCRGHGRLRGHGRGCMPKASGRSEATKGTIKTSGRTEEKVSSECMSFSLQLKV